jgi:hypothetical protein
MLEATTVNSSTAGERHVYGAVLLRTLTLAGQVSALARSGVENSV